MIVITPTTGSQTIKFVMHNYTTDGLVIVFRDTAKNSNLLTVTQNYKERVLADGGTYEDNTLVNTFLNSTVIGATSVISKNSYYNELTVNFTTAPVEGRTYEMLIALATDRTVFHKETIFCTAQAVDDYTINNGVYNMKDDYPASADNEFVYYG